MPAEKKRNELVLVIKACKLQRTFCSPQVTQSSAVPHAECQQSRPPHNVRTYIYTHTEVQATQKTQWVSNFQ